MYFCVDLEHDVHEALADARAQRVSMHIAFQIERLQILFYRVLSLKLLPIRL